MHTRFRRELAALPALFAMSEEFCSSHETLQQEKNTLDLVLEEIFTNVVKYGNARSEEVLVTLDRQDEQLVVSVTDFDADRFDIREAPQADTTLPLEQRKPGGLGIHLIRRLVDRIEYDYEDRTSTTTIFKRLGDHVRD